MTIEYDDFERVELRIGTVTAVEDFPLARNPSYRITVDFGPDLGERRSSVQATNYSEEDLLGAQVIAVVNFAPKNIAGFMSEVLVLGVPGRDGRISLLTPSRGAERGGRVY